MYVPRYDKSWALVIGINAYRHAGPLGYAVNDATEVANTLKSRFGFPADQVTLLLDENATHAAIISSFLSLADGRVNENDRVVVFFASHGVTRTGKRGEVGYLVPVDGQASDLSTLVRWDTLTRDSELIPAKHILFIMDACYGGLAISRAVPPGSLRFLKDMLARYARQVLTAGKANEVVADSGGPRPGHSVFTGHLLDALEGAAKATDEVLSANMIMSYVYTRVSKDPQSRQSPHFGFLDGDGDMIFSAPGLPDLIDASEKGEDVLIPMPVIPTGLEPQSPSPLADTLKQLIPEPRERIRLDDLVNYEIRGALDDLNPELFPTDQSPINADTIGTRLARYEQAVDRLRTVAILLARWGNAEQRPTLARIVARLADQASVRSGGYVAWAGLQWHPVLFLIYTGGVAALAAGNYENLAAIANTHVSFRETGQRSRTVLETAVTGIGEADSEEVFKRLPGYERYYVPRSEYLFRAVQSRLEDLLFLGNTYEELFDRYETIQALIYIDFRLQTQGGAWGPLGRFAWKYRHSPDAPPFKTLLDQTAGGAEGGQLLKAGFFSGQPDRLQKAAEAFKVLLGKLSWY